MSKQAYALAGIMIALLGGALFLNLSIPLVVAITITPAIIAIEIDLIRRMRFLRKWYQNREDLYRVWLSRYGKERKNEIKKYLRLYSRSFGIDERIIHKIGPDDGVMDYYRRNYQPGDADNMEDITFARALKKEYGYESNSADDKLTLGALFERAVKRA